jgi:disulfide oxidoreductase YuzD
MKDKKETAVGWLVEKLNLKYGNDDFIIAFINEIEKAKEMEKKQIIDAFENGQDNIDSDGCHIDMNGAEQYYNETYEQ